VRGEGREKVILWKWKPSDGKWEAWVAVAVAGGRRIGKAGRQARYSLFILWGRGGGVLDLLRGGWRGEEGRRIHWSVQM
jgi:hypothetical protein